jgi:hypothetical protein
MPLIDQITPATLTTGKWLRDLFVPHSMTGAYTKKEIKDLGEKLTVERQSNEEGRLEYSYQSMDELNPRDLSKAKENVIYLSDQEYFVLDPKGIPQKGFFISELLDDNTDNAKEGEIYILENGSYCFRNTEENTREVKNIEGKIVGYEPAGIISLPSLNEAMRDSRFQQVLQRITAERSHTRTAFAADNSATEEAPARALKFKNLLKAALLKTYEFDGYDVTTNEFTTTKGITEHYRSHSFNRLMYVAGLLGLPNRPDDTKETSQKLDITGGGAPKLDTQVNFFPKLTPGQFLKNFIGGWRDLADESASKKMRLLQFFVIPLKGMIFCIKLLTFPLKLLLNVAKFFTEFLPVLIADTSAQAIGSQVRRLSEVNETKKISYKGLRQFARGSLIGLLGLVYYSTKLLSVVGRAITSPEKNARIAFAYGRAFNITHWAKSSKVIGIFLGIVGGALSIAVTAAIWAITLPLLIGAVMSFVPAITPLVTWMLQLPLVGTSLGMVHGALATISSVIGAAFAPAITFLASFIVGLQVPAQAIALGATLAVIAAPSVAILSKVADVLSNLWVSWMITGPFPSLFKAKEGYQKLAGDGDQLRPRNDADDVPLLSPRKQKDVRSNKESGPIDDKEIAELAQGLTTPPSNTIQLSPRSQRVAKIIDEDLKKANSADKSATGTAEEVDSPQKLSNPTRRPQAVSDQTTPTSQGRGRGNAKG